MSAQDSNSGPHRNTPPGATAPQEGPQGPEQGQGATQGQAGQGQPLRPQGPGAGQPRPQGQQGGQMVHRPGQGAGQQVIRPGQHSPQMQARIQAAMQQPVLPPAGPARLHRRHYGMAISFILMVIIPVLLSAVYIYTRASDQYASYVGFSVRSESAPSPADVLGGLGSLVGVTSSSTSDTDILYKFIQSRDLVERVNARIDLREVWSKAPGDPIFGFNGGPSLEDLVEEWERKVRIHYDSGMIDLRILAFDPVDAQTIANAILEEGGILINQLNDIAREDALRYARDELDRAQDRLREARQEVTEFRNRYQLVDPVADVQGQIGVVTSLQQQLAEQLVGLGLLQANAQPEDPRIGQAELRIQVIRDQIEAERQKFGSTGGEEALSDVVGQFEILTVDRQFAVGQEPGILGYYREMHAQALRRGLQV